VLEAGQEGTRLLRAEGDLWEVATLLAFMEGAAAELGRMRLAAEIGEEVEALARRLGHSFSLTVLHDPVRATCRLATDGDLAAVEAAGVRLSEIVVGFRHLSATLLAHAAFLRGDWDEALRRIEEGLRHSPEHHHTAGMDWACYLRVLAYQGRAADVIAVLEGQRDDFPRPGRPNGYGPWGLPTAAIEALFVIGERDRSAQLYPLVREFMETTGVVWQVWTPALVERIAGIGAAAGGEWDTAEAHFRTALRQAEELPFVIEGAETRRWYARMLLERNAAGNRDRARSLLEEAIAVYRRVGMPRHEELARALLLA
jgi:tetratricopeptide (TPR) repeat protein